MPQYDIWRQPYSKQQLSGAVDHIVPVIDTTTKNWKVWDIANMAWVDTGMAADANPIVSVTKTETSGLVDTYTITFKDNSTQTFQVTNGRDGTNGTNGSDGDDGVSPTITVTTINGGHRVTITDADHPNGQSFDVLDGTGAGDMQAATYDPNGAVQTAGGIPAYVSANAQSKVKYASITLPVASWSASGSNYTQTVTISGYTVTANTKVDIDFSAAVVAQMVSDGTVGLGITNANGTLTATAVGEKPTAALTLQVTLSEVTAA